MTEYPPDPNPGSRRIFPPSEETRPVAAWRIYYGDDITYSSAEGSWDEAPAENVQAVKLWWEGFADDGERWSVVHVGEDAYLLKGNSEWKIGRLISDSDFLRQYWKAFYDNRVPGE
jgi:hypothetical protein